MKVYWTLLAGLVLISLTLSVVRADVDCDALASRHDLSEAEQKQLLECLEEANNEIDLIKQLEGDDGGSGRPILKKRGWFSWIGDAVKSVGDFYVQNAGTINAVVKTAATAAVGLIGKREMAIPSKAPELDCSNLPYAELTDDVQLNEYMEKLSEEQREKVLACVDLTVLGAETIEEAAMKIKDWVEKDKMKQVADQTEAPTEKTNDVEANAEKTGPFAKLKAAVSKIMANLRKPKKQ